MNRKRCLTAVMAFALALICLSACRTAGQAGFTADRGVQSALEAARTEEPNGEGAIMVSQTNVERLTGVFDFENRNVLLNKLQSDIMEDQISLKEFVDPFTGEKNK